MTRIYKFYLFAMVLATVAFIVMAQMRKVPQTSTIKEYSKNPYSLYLAGSYAKKTNDFSTAQKYFDELEKKDSSEEITKNSYIIAIMNGDFEKAKQVAPKADNTVYFINVMNFAKTNDYKSALTEINKIPSSKQEVLKYLLSAWLYAGLDKKDSAYAELAKIKTKNIGSLETLHKFYIAIHFNDAKTVNVLLPLLEKENLSIRSVYLITQYYCKNGRFKEAQDLVNAKLRDDSMIDILNDYIINYKQSDATLFTDINVGISEVFSNFGMLIFNPSGWELSVYFTQLSLALTPNHEFSKILLAEILESKELAERANDIYKSVDKESYLYPSSQLKIANNLYSTGNTKGAFKIFNSLIRKYPNYTSAYIYLTEKYIKEHDYKKALKTLTTIEKKIANKQEKHWNIYYYIALCNDKLGNVDKVEDNLATSLVLSPKNPIVMNFLGYFWIEQNKNQENAIKMIEQAVMSNPMDLNYIDSFAWGLYNMGRQKEAMRLLELCVQRNASNPDTRIHLGQTYFDQGRFKEARYQWETALLFKKDLSPLEVKDLQKRLKDLK